MAPPGLLLQSRSVIRAPYAFLSSFSTGQCRQCHLRRADATGSIDIRDSGGGPALIGIGAFARATRVRRASKSLGTEFQRYDGERPQQACAALSSGGEKRIARVGPQA